MAKAPAGGLKGREELKAMGERNGWADDELTARDVTNLSADHYLWFEAFFPARLEHAAEIENNRRLNAERMPSWNARRMWAGNATKDEDEKSRIAGDQFAMRHPQFARTIENATLMIEHMKERDLDATKIESYAVAFLELTEQRKLTVAPAESADDFYKAHPELHDRRTPPVIAARAARTEQTAKHFEAAASAAVKGNVVNVVDYEHEPGRGVPPYSEIDKASLRNLARKMSSAELQAKCESDPSFRKALDALD